MKTKLLVRPFRIFEVFVAAITVLPLVRALGDVPPTLGTIRHTGTDFEGKQTFQLEWNAMSNATYIVQERSSLAPDEPWISIDAVTPETSVGTVKLRIRPRDQLSEGAADANFYRLVLPQPKIFAVEPAVVAQGIAVDMYVVGECFGSNDVLQINGVTQSNVVFNGHTLLTKPSFTPSVPGTYVFQLVVSGKIVSTFNVTCADAFANPEMVLQRPPEEPPAGPSAGSVLDLRGELKAVRNENVSLKESGKWFKVTLDGDPLKEEAHLILSSGEVVREETDLAIPGRGLDFVWTRTYNSRIGQDTPQGSRWIHSYDIHLQPVGGDILIHDGTGRRDLFRLQTNGTYTCPEFFREGTITGGVFRLTFADTGYWEFKPLLGSPTDGKVAYIVDRNGNTMSLNYDGSGRLIQIVDDFDRTNTVAYNTDGRVASVTDFSGRTVTYHYYRGLPGEPGGAGDLASVTSPPVTGTPNTNDFPFGKTTTYTYSKDYLDNRENHLLLSVIDAKGQVQYEHVYQHNQTDFDFLRCNSVKRGTNTPTIFTYLPQTASPSNQFATLRCILNNPMGDVTERFYDARNRPLKLEEFTGRATPGVPVTATVNRPAGKLRTTDPDSYVTKLTWNNDSLCTSETSPGGQRWQMIYRQDFGQVKAQKKADLLVLHEYPCCDGADTNGDGVNDLTERVWRYEYDPRFGTGEGYGGRSIVDRLGDWGGKISTGGGGGGMTKGWDGRSSNMRSRLDALEAKLQAFGLLARFGRGPRQSTSLDGSWANGDSIDVQFGSGLGRTSVQDVEVRYSAPTTGFLLSTHGIPAQNSFVTSVTDPRGQVTTAGYDTKGNATNVGVHVPFIVDRDPPVLDFTYNSHGELIGVTNAADANGHRRYDEYVKNYGFTTRCIVDAGPGGLRLTNTFERDVRGNIIRYVNARGHDCLYTWNSLDQLMRVETPTNIVARRATSYRYDANDNPIEISSEVRGGTDNIKEYTLGTCEWENFRLPSRIVIQVSTNQFCTNEFVYNANGQCVLIRGGDAVSGADPHHTISLQYDERRKLFRKTAAAGSTVQTTTQWDYDANGNPIRVSEGLEDTPSVTTMEYDGFASSSRIYKVKQGMANVIAAFGEVEYGMMRAAGPTPLAGAIRTARLTQITDPLGNVTTYNHDASDNLKVVRQFGQLNDVPGPTGNIRLAESRYEYDALNLLTRSRDLFFNPTTQTPIGDGERTTTFGYAPNGQCTSVTDDLGRMTTFGYNPIGWSIATTNAKYEVKLTYRDEVGNPVGLTIINRPDLGGPPQVFTRTNVFDSLNRCVSTTDNVGNNDNWVFDSLNRVVMATDPRGIHSFFEYDLLGRQTLAISDLDGDGVPEPGTDFSERATWSTSNGRLLATTDSHDNTTSYAHDSIGRVTQITHADGTHRSLVWSPRSNLISEQDANGTVAFHTYDLNNRCISNSYVPGPTVATTTTFETFAYDGRSQLVAATNNVSHSELEYDSLGNNVGNHRDGWNTVAVVTGDGFRTALTYPSGRTLTFAYDALNQCTNVAESGNSLINLSYAGPGRIARMNYGNGTRAQITYDGLDGVANPPGDFGHGEVSSVTHGIAGTPQRIAAVNLKWDRNGNKTERTDIIFPPAIPRTNELALAYDAADQLTAATLHSGSSLLRDTAYGLDLMGNRTNVIGAAFCSGLYFMQAQVPGPMDFQMNQYTATPCDSRTYDENGNIIGRGAGPGSFISYSYDCHNRLVSVNDSGVPVAAYAYNALGQRISKTVFSTGLPVTTDYIYDGNNVIEERENGAVTATYVRPPRCFGAGQPKPQSCDAMRRDGQDYYFHTDDQGNVLALSTTGGAVAERYDYDDYGKVTFLTSDGLPTSATSSSVGNPYCWNGLRLDAETGLQNNDGGGYFEPQTGRYTRRGLTVNARSDTPIGCDSVNPWSGGGGSANAMEKGKVKFFNDTKGFGRLAAGGGGGGGLFAIETRNTLKSYFEIGDIPTGQDFKDTIDSCLNLVDDGLTHYPLSGKVSRPVLKSFFETGDKPTQAQFGVLIDSLQVFSGDIHRIDLVTRVTR